MLSALIVMHVCVCLFSYESMRDLCNCYNKVMDDCRQLVIFSAVLLDLVFLCLASAEWVCQKDVYVFSRVDANCLWQIRGLIYPEEHREALMCDIYVIGILQFTKCR